MAFCNNSVLSFRHPMATLQFLHNRPLTLPTRFHHDLPYIIKLPPGPLRSLVGEPKLIGFYANSTLSISFISAFLSDSNKAIELKALSLNPARQNILDSGNIAVELPVKSQEYINGFELVLLR